MATDVQTIIHRVITMRLHQNALLKQICSLFNKDCLSLLLLLFCQAIFTMASIVMQDVHHSSVSRFDWLISGEVRAASWRYWRDVPLAGEGERLRRWDDLWWSVHSSSCPAPVRKTHKRHPSKWTREVRLPCQFPSNQQDESVSRRISFAYHSVAMFDKQEKIKKATSSNCPRFDPVENWYCRSTALDPSVFDQHRKETRTTKSFVRYSTSCERFTLSAFSLLTRCSNDYLHSIGGQGSMERDQRYRHQLKSPVSLDEARARSMMAMNDFLFVEMVRNFHEWSNHRLDALQLCLLPSNLCRSDWSVLSVLRHFDNSP